MNGKTDTPFNLTAHGLTVREVHRDPPPGAIDAGNERMGES